MKINGRTFQRLALIVAGGVLLNWLLNHFDIIGGILSTLWGLLFPFVLGLILAFLLNMPMSFLERVLFRERGGRLRRPVSFVLALLLVVGVLALVVGLAGPQLWKTLVHLSASMPGYISSVEQALEPYYSYIPAAQEWLENLDVDWANLAQQVSNFLSSGAGNFFQSAVSVATSIVGGVVSFFIGVVFACYLLLDKEHLVAQLKGLLKAYLPNVKYEQLVDLGQLTYRTFANFISGQCVEAVLLTVVYLIILGVGGFQYALLISVFVGFCSLIPLIGAYLGCFLGVFLLWVSMGFGRALAFVIIMIVVQQVEGNFIYPHVIGSSVGLPPVWMLVAVTVGGGLAGIFGMMFLIPLFSVLYTLLHRDAKARLAKKGIVSPVSELPPRPKRHPRKKDGDETAVTPVQEEAAPAPEKPTDKKGSKNKTEG